MINYNINHYFVLSASCKIVKGANRSVVIDYLRKDVNLIPNQYYDIIEQLDRTKIKDILEMIDSDSHEGFNSFLEFMLENEFGFLAKDPDMFPQVSDQLHDEHFLLRDAIIEIDASVFDMDVFQNAIRQIDELYCEDLQIRLLSSVDLELLTRVFDFIQTTDVNFVELHFASQQQFNQDELSDLLDRCTALTRIYVYSAEKTHKVEHHTQRSGYDPVLIGTTHYQETPFNEHNCGIITFDNLIFNNLDLYQLHKSHNGCLHKKLTIDKHGNFKNCPSMSQSFGNVQNIAVRDLIKDESFKKMGSIKKDEISICKDCEFRYNCTDCRAFLSEPDDIRSKPLKCGYNPYTNEWAAWSTHPMKSYQL